MQQNLGTTIRQARVAHQLLLRKAAAALDIDTGLLSKIERNERRPTRDQVQRFAQLYQLDADALLVDWLSDKVAQELEGERLGREILKAAELKLTS